MCLLHCQHTSNPSKLLPTVKRARNCISFCSLLQSAAVCPSHSRRCSTRLLLHPPCGSALLPALHGGPHWTASVLDSKSINASSRPSLLAPSLLALLTRLALLTQLRVACPPSRSCPCACRTAPAATAPPAQQHNSRQRVSPVSNRNTSERPLDGTATPLQTPCPTHWHPCLTANTQRSL
jgi:hypothetical protein